MKRLLSLLFIASALGAHAQSLLPGYNAQYYPTSLAAAKGIAMPFLLRQGYLTAPGVVVADSTLHHGANSYVVGQVYQNGGTDYTLPSSQYTAFGLSNVTKVWPYGIPNIVYNPAKTAWQGIGDCVSYVMRALSATGDTSTNGNAYLNLISTIKAANTTIFASKGYSATAYQLGAAFPTLSGNNPHGWQYVAGNVLADSIEATNKAIRPTVGKYNGVAKGGFAGARGGDVLAWSYPRSAPYNGHLMILEDAPQLLNADSLRAYMPTQSTTNIMSLLSRYKVYAVPLLDCSGKKAHFRDSRLTVSGIGHGTVLILTSISGDIPQGFIFGPGSASGSRIGYDTIGVEVFAISVGRWKNSSSTAVTGISRFEGFRCWPNPARNILHIASEEHGWLTITDALGRIMLHSHIDKDARLDISAMPAGTYYLSLQNSSGAVLQKTFQKL